jgi:hypothetical protein
MCQWYHYNCFFQKQRPKSTEEIEHFESLRYEDQEKIRKSVGSVAQVVGPAAKGKGKGKKRSAAENAALKDFGVEYAASGRAVCCGCAIKIMKDDVRIKKTVYDTEVGMKFGGQALWHHVECFAQVNSNVEIIEKFDILAHKPINLNFSCAMNWVSLLAAISFQVLETWKKKTETL